MTKRCVSTRAYILIIVRISPVYIDVQVSVYGEEEDRLQLCFSRIYGTLPSSKKCSILLCTYCDIFSLDGFFMAILLILDRDLQ